MLKTKLLIIDTPENLRRRIFQSRIMIRLKTIAKQVTNAINKLPYITKLEQSGNQLMIDIKDSDNNRPELVETIVKAGGRILEVTQERHSLEDVYLTLMKEDKHEL